MSLVVRAQSRKRKGSRLSRRLFGPRAVKRLRISAPVSRPAPARLYKGPFQQSVVTTHKYVDFVALNPTSGVVALDNWSLTNMFDPYVGAGGHQPLGFDQMAALYRKYMVISAELQFTAYTANGNSLPMFIHICAPADLIATNSISSDALLEKPNVTGFISTSSMNTMRRTYDAKRWFGRSYDAGNLTSLSTTSPSTNVNAQVGYGPLDATSDLNAASFVVVITYKAIWTEPALVAQS